MISLWYQFEIANLLAVDHPPLIVCTRLVQPKDSEIFSVLKKVLPITTALLLTISSSIGEDLAVSQPAQLEGIGQGIKDSVVALVKDILRAVIDIVNVAALPLIMLGTMMYFSGFMRYEGGRIMMAAIVSLFLGQAFLPMI